MVHTIIGLSVGTCWRRSLKGRDVHLTPNWTYTVRAFRGSSSLPLALECRTPVSLPEAFGGRCP